VTDVLRDALGDLHDEARAVDAESLADAALARHRRRRGATILGTVAAVVVLLVASAGLAAAGALDRAVHRVPVPVATDQGGRSATSVLLIGKQVLPTGQRDADTFVLVELPEGRRQAYVLSMSRSTLVGPAARSESLRDAYARGGVPAAVGSVQRITGVRPEHVVVTELAGVTALTDAIGGVDVRVQPYQVDRDSARKFLPGVHHLSGPRVGAYLRERYGMPNGDLDRVRRHQVFLLALARKLVAADPGQLAAAVRDVAPLLTVDEGMDVPAFAASLRDLAPADIRFAVLPGEVVSEGDRSVVRPDRATATFGTAAAKGELDAWFDRYGSPAPTVGP
jgi:LCP family protein required for cell wall assembly